MHQPADSRDPILSSDRCRTLHSLIDKLIQSNVINSKTALLDARGNFDDLATHYKEYEWIQFDHNQTLEDLWNELNPHAKEWWISSTSARSNLQSFRNYQVLKTYLD